MPAGRVAGQAGLYGKLPARRDFVRAGLPRDFVEPWDRWWQRGLAATQEMAGKDWLESWLEAPVWRFVLPPGLLGRAAMAGIWLPSVDGAGRYFPLTVAAAAPEDWAGFPGSLEHFLAGAEAAGMAALEQDLAPEEVLRQAGAALEDAAAIVAGGNRPPAGQACWWTEGGPRVAARLERGAGLPEGPGFAGLLNDAWPVALGRVT